LHPETKEHHTSNEKVRQNCELNIGETIVGKERKKKKNNPAYYP